MSTTSRWRGTAGFKLVSWILASIMTLAPTAAAAWPAWVRSVPLAPRAANGIARATEPAPVAASPAIAPRRLRPQALEVIAGAGATADPWSWFDGSATPRSGAAESVRVRATLPAPTRLVALGVWGGAAGALTLSVERDGKTVPIEGLAGLDVTGLSDGWHTFAAREGTFARSLVIEWESRGGSPRELE